MTIFKMEWQTSRKGLRLWSVISSSIILLFMSIFPSMQTNVMKELIDSKLGGLPENMLKIFHLDSGPSLMEPAGYFGYIYQYIFIAACVYAAILGSQALVKEETNGTIEFLYGQPVSRRKIVIEKFVAALSMLIIFWCVNFAVSMSAMVLFDQTDSEFSGILRDLLKILLPEWFVLVFFLAVGFVLSSLLRSANKSISISLGSVFGLYLLGILGDLQEKFSLLKQLSPMAQGAPAFLLANDFPFSLIIILTIVSLLCLTSSIFIYQRKDLQI